MPGKGDVSRRGAQPLPTVSAVPKAPYSDFKKMGKRQPEAEEKTLG